MLDKPKIAIVYDWIDKWGGVERVLLTLREMFPEAVFYTSYYDSRKAEWAKDLNIKTSFIQKFPSFIKTNRILSFPFYPFAFESFNFTGFDLAISVTSSFAKSVITRPETKHICYLLTPTRYLWTDPEIYLGHGIKHTLLGPYLAYLKKWDFVAAQRPDKIVAISKNIQDRCQKYYKRESTVIYPPFDTESWAKIKNQKSKIKTTYQISNITNKKYHLVVSRLEPYKRVDIAVQTFNRLGTLLVIVGQGSEEKRLKSAARKNVQFIPYVSDNELAFLYSHATALIMPQEEDFGYVSLEAQFFGCPVVAYDKGGAKETVVDGQTGLFFSEQSVPSLGEALERFKLMSYNLKASTKKYGCNQVALFSKKKFSDQFSQVINI